MFIFFAQIPVIMRQLHFKFKLVRNVSTHFVDELFFGIDLCMLYRAGNSPQRGENRLLNILLYKVLATLRLLELDFPVSYKGKAFVDQLWYQEEFCKPVLRAFVEIKHLNRAIGQN